MTDDENRAAREVATFDEGDVEAIAREIVDDGLATRELTMALDQLVADRTNGESLEAATDNLRAVLARGDHRRPATPTSGDPS